MTSRRTLMSFAAALVSLSAGCVLFRPIDPNPYTPRAEREPEAAAESPAPPVSEPAAQPAPVPVAVPPSAAPPPVSVPQAAVSPPPVVSPAPAVTTPAPPPASPAPTLRTAEVRAGDVKDGNITAMVLALNNTDISYARLVPARAQRDDVKQFAERMLTDHTGVNGLVTDLLQKLDIAPEDNAISLDMRDESANNRDILRELSGFAFDSTYMENEVAYHRKFLATIDNVMLPSARSSELRSLLTAIRPAVAAHLAHAEQTQANVLAKK